MKFGNPAEWHEGQWRTPHSVHSVRRRTCFPHTQADRPRLVRLHPDNDGSANSTFLVGKEAILVVDTGVDAKEGGKLLAAIRGVSNLPVKYIVNTHYHPDHQGEFRSWARCSGDQYRLDAKSHDFDGSSPPCAQCFSPDVF